MRGEKYARDKGLEVVGFYHSHPDDVAVPSQYDLEHAWPTYSYIVMAVEKGGPRICDPGRWKAIDRSSMKKKSLSSSLGL
jgi:proteasome lid subunit RPN8/RPN11